MVGNGVGGTDVGLAGGMGVVVGAEVGVGDRTNATAGSETAGLLTSGKWTVCPVSSATLHTKVAVGTTSTIFGTGGSVTPVVGGGNGVNVGKTLTRGGDEVGFGMGCGIGSGAHAPNPQTTKSPTKRCQTVKENVLSVRAGGYVFCNSSSTPL